MRFLVVIVLAFLAGCSSALRDVPRPVSHALENPQQTFLGRTLAALGTLGTLGKAPDGFAEESGFRLVVQGAEAFQLRAVLADVAERTLDLQYYIVAEDATATLLLHRALLAAHRGVRVRLLIDDMYALGRDFDLATLAQHPNVQVRVFNPFTSRLPLGLTQLLDYLGDSDRLNRRMHNKLWIADNAAAVIGGRNLGDAYFAFGASQEFADVDALAAGPVVKDISRSFDDYWNSSLSVPIAALPGRRPEEKDFDRILMDMAERAERFRDTDYARALRGGEIAQALRAGRLGLVQAKATVVYDPPEQQQATGARAPGRIAPVLRDMVESAERELILISPYFIPAERGSGVLAALVRRGVRVRVLTNSLGSTDVPVVHGGYARYRPRLLEAGVEIHERRRPASDESGPRPGLSSGASLHAKAVVVDRKVVMLGSMNLDPRSLLTNKEVAVRIDSPVIASQLATLFEETVSGDQSFQVALAAAENGAPQLTWILRAGGKTRSFSEEPDASWWRRILASLFGALAPEELL